MKRFLLKFVMLLLGTVLLFALLIDPGILAAPITLLIGWWPSMLRLGGAWRPTLNGTVPFVLTVVVMVAGGHVFLRWLYATVRGGKDSRWPIKWRWKWTGCGFAILGCTLLAICSFILTTHQIYWISKSSDPLVGDPFTERSGLSIVAMCLQTEANESQWDSVKTRESFLHSDFTRFGQPAAETIQPVWIEKDNHSLRAIILIPRRPLHRAVARIAVLQPGAKSTNYNLGELPQVLASFGIGNAGPMVTGTTSRLP